jgi:hypothetical protein
MKYKTTTEPTYARSELQERLKESGHKGLATIDEMEKYIKGFGYRLPTEHEGDYGFRMVKYTRISLNYSDCLAELIILINEK